MASWERGVKIWTRFRQAVVLELGVLLFWVLVECCFLRRFQGVRCAGGGCGCKTV